MNYTIEQGDCLDLMKNIPSKSVDMILADLPYGTTRNKWDSIISLEELWGGYKRVIKDNGAVVLFSQMPFSATLVCSNPQWFRYEWIWEKEQATGFLNAKKMPLKIHENILVFYKSLPTYTPQMRCGFNPYKKANGPKSLNYDKQKNVITVSNGERYPIDVIKFSRDTSRIHPTQKPVALLEYLINTYTNPEETVLDNCMGSGSTGVACANTGRNFIGFETESEYFEIAKTRIENAYKTNKMY